VWAGGWNSRGVRAVYTALEPAPRSLKLLCTKGFKALDTAHHVADLRPCDGPDRVHVVQSNGRIIPNPTGWCQAAHGEGQKSFGRCACCGHLFRADPSPFRAQLELNL